jgi:hypothetical protein
MKKFILMAGMLVSPFISQTVWGHGEEKPGPHKGYLRMPGAFHIELVPQGNSKFKVYLLDIEWKNPSVENSKLEIKAINDGKTADVKCGNAQGVDHFSCQLPEGYSLKKGELRVSAIRQKSIGAEMRYDLPLTFNVEAMATSHNGHH